MQLLEDIQAELNKLKYKDGTALNVTVAKCNWSMDCNLRQTVNVEPIKATTAVDKTQKISGYRHDTEY